MKNITIKRVLKRDGRIQNFNEYKIYCSIEETIKEIRKNNQIQLDENIEDIIKSILLILENKKLIEITTEEINQVVIDVLNKKGYNEIAKIYTRFRDTRNKEREANSSLIKNIKEITFAKSTDSNLKRDNGNINGDTPMGMMLQYGSTVAKKFADEFLISPDIREHVEAGDIYVHDKDFLPTGTLTCCQIPLDRLFKNGFDTGHGYLREPQSIRSYASLAAIAIQSNQNDQHGGQAIPLFDFYMAPGITKSLKKNIKNIIELLFSVHIDKNEIGKKDIKKEINNIFENIDLDLFKIKNKDKLLLSLKESFYNQFKIDALKINDLIDIAYINALEQTEKDTYQAMEAFVHNLNTMHSRSGGQVPFSSINFGMDTTEEGRMVSRNLLLSQEAGLGNNETPIFPILIFQVKEGVNYNPGDKNYDLFKLSIRVSAKRLFPNYVFVDAPFNLQYYKPDDPETIIATMGCRTRVIGNINGKETPVGRGNLSFTTINLPRLGIKYGVMYRKNYNIEDNTIFDYQGFFRELDSLISICIKQLLERYEIQRRKLVSSFPFLMGQGTWTGSEKLANYEQLGDVINSGTLGIGFIGLAECLIGLAGQHHGESEEMQKLGLEIIGHMRKRTDEATKKYKLNFSLLGTPAEGLSGFFTRIDKKEYGIIPGITDKEYYTNSFHVPVYYKITFVNKINKEAPYHALTNGGHITYVEMDGDLSKNLEAFEIIIRYMKDAGIGYGSVNHPVDRDPVCGYSGIIEGNICPNCGRDITKNIQIEETIKRL